MGPVFGELFWSADAATANFGLTIGIIVQTGGTPTADAADPQDSPHVDWLYWRRCFPHPASTTNGLCVIENKSMRRLDEVGEQLYLSVHNNTAMAAEIQFAFSTLVRLP